METIRPILMGVAFALSAAGASAQVDSNQLVTLEIKSQVLRDALNDWAQKTGFQLIAPSSELMKRLVVPAVAGDFTPRAALEQLLAGTPLTYELLDGRTVVIREMAKPPASSGMQRIADTREVANDRRRRSADTPSPGADTRQPWEEIVVTAQRREERLQDVPISMSVLSTQALDTSSDRGVADALNRVPGVINAVSSQTARNGSNAGTIIVRGVSPDTSGAQTTAFYLDSIPFGFVRRFYQPDASAFDLARVEVLRGPQGTLYGAGSLNGVVRVLTSDPDLEKFQLKTRLSAGSTEEGGESYRGDLAVNIPIIEGKLAARAVVGYQDIGGWIDKPIRKDANDAEVANYRLKIRAQPTDALTIGLSGWLSRADVGAPTSTFNGVRSASIVEEPSSTDYDAFGLTVAYDFSRASLSSNTSYIDFANVAVVDYQPFAANQFLNLRFSSEVFAQEVALHSNGDGPWAWSVGGIYRDVEDLNRTTRTWQPTGPNPGALAANYIAPTLQRAKSESFAVFGELTRELIEGRLDLTLGVRYFEDEVTDNELSRLTWQGGTVPVAPTDAGKKLINVTRKFDHTSPRVVLTWHPQDTTTLYLSYGEGFRSGINQGPSIQEAAPQFPPADPDTLKNFELGMKGSLWGARINYEAAVYYSEWKDAQQVLNVIVRQPDFIQPAIVSAEVVSGPGFELSAMVNPFEGLTLSATYSYNDLTLEENLITRTPANVPFVLYAKGDRLNFSPEFTASGAIDYQFDLGASGYQALLSSSINYIDRVITGRNDATTKFYAEAVSFVRASMGVRAPGGWTASLYGDNLTNESGLSQDQFRLAWNTYARPRSIGVQFQYSY
jgi:iron complex outermembrane recepter protein